MNLDNYRNFRVIVEMGSLAAAAKKLHLAQSALSSQLKAFEEKFGAELIIKKRGVRRVLLTEAGKALYEKSGYICKLDETVSSFKRWYGRKSYYQLVAIDVYRFD